MKQTRYQLQKTTRCSFLLLCTALDVQIPSLILREPDSASMHVTPTLNEQG